MHRKFLGVLNLGKIDTNVLCDFDDYKRPVMNMKLDVMPNKIENHVMHDFDWRRPKLAFFDNLDVHLFV